MNRIVKRAWSICQTGKRKAQVVAAAAVAGTLTLATNAHAQAIEIGGFDIEDIGITKASILAAIGGILVIWGGIWGSKFAVGLWRKWVRPNA